MQTESTPEFGERRADEVRRDGGCGIIYDPRMKLFAVGRDEGTGFLRLFSGGVEAGEDVTDGILREVREESGLHDFSSVEIVARAIAHYHNALKHVNRVGHATCLLIVLHSTATVSTKREAHETFELAWAREADLRLNWLNHGRGSDHWAYFLEKALARLQELGYDATPQA